MTNALPELDPSSTALLLMDFQNAMVGAIGDAAAGCFPLQPTSCQRHSWQLDDLGDEGPTPFAATIARILGHCES
jgi:hypothetical protein